MLKAVELYGGPQDGKRLHADAVWNTIEFPVPRNQHVDNWDTPSKPDFLKNYKYRYEYRGFKKKEGSLYVFRFEFAGYHG